MAKTYVGRIWMPDHRERRAGFVEGNVVQKTKQKNTMKPGPILPVLLTLGFTLSARATVVALWTFEDSKPSATGQTIGAGLSPESGSGTATGYHSNASTVWSNPVGNGSGESFSANTWSIGDYYQFQTSLAGFEDVQLSWGQTRSSTGPSDFSLSWSTDGAVFNPFQSYTVGDTSWTSGTFHPGSVVTADLSGVSSLDNGATVFFRLTATSAPSGTSGSSRVDDFQISATPVVTPVPEAATVGAIGFGVIMLGAAWRRSRSR